MSVRKAFITGHILFSIKGSTLEKNLSNVMSVGKLFITVIGPLPSVCSLMLNKVGTPTEALPTFVTLIGSVTRVGFLMPIKV